MPDWGVSWMQNPSFHNISLDSYLLFQCISFSRCAKICCLFPSCSGAWLPNVSLNVTSPLESCDPRDYLQSPIHHFLSNSIKFWNLKLESNAKDALFCHDTGFNVVHYYMITYHCSKKGPYFGHRVPRGTIFTFGIPHESLFIFQGPCFQFFGY